MAERYLTMVPIRGKFTQVYVDGVPYQIYRVNPATPDVLGTTVPYAVGIKLLCNTPAVVSVLPEVGSDGKAIQTIDEADLVKIKQVSLSNRPSPPAPLMPTTPLGAASDSEVRELRAQLNTANASAAELLKLVNDLRKEQGELREKLATVAAAPAEKAGKGKASKSDES